MPTSPPQPANAPATPLPWFQFGKLQKTPQRTVALAGSRVTPNGPLAALLFDDLRAELGEVGQGLSLVATAALELAGEVLGDAAFRGYAVDVRGTCSKTPGGRGVVVVQVGGTVQTQVFGYGETADGGWLARFYSFEPRASNNSQPTPPQLTPLTVNVFLSVQRRTPAEQVLLSVESIDITADRV